MKRLILLTLFLCPLYGFSQDTIRVGHKFRHFNLLELGTKTDLIHHYQDGKLMRMTLKTRITELVTIDEKQLVKITHKWNSPGTNWTGDFVYYCEPETMTPVQHIRTTATKGKEAFAFKGDRIVALDSAANNSQEDFILNLTEPTYNWEIDLETYSLLPMKMGYHAVMTFYHPGSSSPPDFYHFKVIGDEKLKLPNGDTLDCWILYSDYNGTQSTKFWYTKSGQNFIKTESKFNGLTMHKKRLY